MRIGINALYLIPGRVGGSEIYLRNICKQFNALAGAHDFVIFVNKESSGVFEAIAPRVRVVECAVRAENRPARILWEQFVLPFQTKGHRLDVLLSAGMTAPFICPVPSYVMIYDLQHVNMPRNFSWWYLLFLKGIIYLSAKSADGILTLSEKSKNDIIRHYGIKGEKITVTYLAADGNVFFRRAPEEAAAVRKKYNLPERFILYIASSLPHKNYGRLLEAYKRVKEKEAGVKLVLIGARDYGFEAIEKKIAALGLGKGVVFLGWLPFEDIPAIYSAAEVFVFPSLHEGFGIPVIEAFSCGAPVVCSKVEPVGEVAGGAALLVDPLDTDEMAGRILEVLRDAELREKLIRDGFTRAAEFSWEKTARDTLSAINVFYSAR
ncbi:MAG: glycosyltransferase family 4 protein [Deltaproteobacteria bacterium]|nr:glycosyltransferase family 4 protein [Deltaproteobacteria bacterium]